MTKKNNENRIRILFADDPLWYDEDYVRSSPWSRGWNWWVKQRMGSKPWKKRAQ